MGLLNNDDVHNGIAMMYFSFTSLSTVGFGDFHPKSDSERIFCAFMILFGVGLFSLFMAQFIEILNKYEEMNSDLDDSDNLSKFMELIRHFNHGNYLDLEFHSRIEAFFDYKWKFDRTQAINDDDEKAMLSQLP